MASPWEFSIHPCLLRGEISSISFSLPQHSAHPFFTVSSRQVNMSWEWRGKKKKENKTTSLMPEKKETRCSLSLQVPTKLNRHRSPERRPGARPGSQSRQVKRRGAPGSRMPSWVLARPRPPACPRSRPPSPSRGGRCLPRPRWVSGMRKREPAVPAPHSDLFSNSRSKDPPATGVPPTAGGLANRQARVPKAGCSASGPFGGGK